MPGAKQDPGPKQEIGWQADGAEATSLAGVSRRLAVGMDGFVQICKLVDEGTVGASSKDVRVGVTHWQVGVLDTGHTSWASAHTTRACELVPYCVRLGLSQVYACRPVSKAPCGHCCVLL